MTEFVFGSVDILKSSIDEYAVMTQEIPWNLIKDRIGTPRSVVMVRNLEHGYLDDLVRNAPPVSTVIGVGGGVSIDAAKYLAWKRQCSLILVPTIISADAYVSHQIAVRDNGVVNYIGYVTPAQIVIDYKSIRSAPRRLNTAGAGDLYCCRTALFDWKLSHERTDESYDEKIVASTCEALDTLVANAGEIKAVTEKGIHTLVDLHREMVRLADLAGKARPNEGSEHVFFYALEEVLERSFVHGETVGTGIYISSHFQSQSEDEVAEVMDRLGLMFRPRDYGISKEQFVAAVLRMKGYSENSNYRSRY